MITPEIAQSIDESVLSWLATISADGIPNVSPKEAFLHDGSDKILVANIASPETVTNILANDHVCLSFVDVFVQRGYKIKGRASILEPNTPGYDDRQEKLRSLIGSNFPIRSIIEIVPTEIAKIVAPSYHLFPETGPLDRIRESLTSYRVADYQARLNSTTIIRSDESSSDHDTLT